MLGGHGACVSDPKTAQKLKWLEPSMSEVHDNNNNNRQIRPANQNMMSQLIEILSAIHPRKTPSSIVHAALGAVVMVPEK
jgi:hypothetical protein